MPVVAAESFFCFLKCHPITCEESHTGPSIITLSLLADRNAIGHVPKTLQDLHQINAPPIINV